MCTCFSLASSPVHLGCHTLLPALHGLHSGYRLDHCRYLLKKVDRLYTNLDHTAGITTFLNTCYKVAVKDMLYKSTIMLCVLHCGKQYSQYG